MGRRTHGQADGRADSRGDNIASGGDNCVIYYAIVILCTLKVSFSVGCTAMCCHLPVYLLLNKYQPPGV